MNDTAKKALGFGALAVGAYFGVRAIQRKLRHFDLQGKTVLITGGSRGLGLVLARMFVQEGCRVAICARNDEELERAYEDLHRRTADVFAVPCDVSDREQVNEMIRKVRDHFGEIHVLVNNAGVIEVGPMELQTVEDYEGAMNAHFWGPLYCSLAVLPEMRARRSGRIVNISSIGGKISAPHSLPYCSSKFALVGLSEGMHAETAKDGIRVCTVCPGLMRTGSHRNAMFKGQNQAEYTLMSLMCAFPLSSMNAESAARQIVSAVRNGDTEIVLSIPAKVVATLHALFPGMTSDILGVINRLLPGPGGMGAEKVLGKDSQTALTRSWLTRGIERAAQENNEA